MRKNTETGNDILIREKGENKKFEICTFRPHIEQDILA